MNNASVILTPNRRLSATLGRKHTSLQIKASVSSWQTPTILPLQAWLQTLWQQCVMESIPTPPTLLLSPSQEVALWEKIIAGSKEHALLLQTTPTAELAAKAWALLKLWRVPISHPMMTLTADGQAFQRWASTFSAECLAHQWLDLASLPDLLAETIPTCQIDLPKNIYLAGFTETAPQYQALFDIFTAAGCHVSTHQPEDAAIHLTAETVCLADEDTEIQTMARWAKAIHSARPITASDADNIIGCIIPRLDVQRDRVLQIFSDVFSEDLTLAAHHDHLPFNISAGKKLSDWPVIRAGLLLLNACIRTLNPSEIARLNHSPFSCTARPPYTLPETTYPPSTWAIQFSEYLNACGWPGTRSLNSDEYQICQRWLDLLGEFATLDVLHPTLNLRQAVSSLQKLAERTVYQPSTPTTPIQISGILEAAGQSFSHLWIMGMDDSQWPFPPRPNPFIPQALQRTLQMPHSSADRELHYCKKLFEQLRAQTSHLTCSYAGQLDDTLLRPASLLQNISVIPPENLSLSLHMPPQEAILSAAVSECFVDDMAPSVTDQETLRGGSRILSLQSACPFRAFAEIRLHAKHTEPEALGLNPKERGKLLHKTLELLWRYMKDSSALHHHDRQLTEHCAREAITLCTGQPPENSRYLTMEWERLVRLVSAWLDIEKERPPFRVVACEAPLTVNLSGLTLELRMDRIDELPDGSHLIIDYKSGKYVSPGDWMGDRPEEPQLPLYCIGTTPCTISALAFAILHPESVKLTGFSARDTGMTAIKKAEKWPDLVSEWQQTLSRLALEFTEGRAVVDPKNGQATCEHCHLQTLCRIHEMKHHVTG